MIQLFRKYFKGDPIIWAVAFALFIISVLSVYSSVSRIAYVDENHSVSFYLAKHIFLLLTGFIAMYIFHLMPYKLFSKLSQILLIISIPLLILTLVRGETVNEASRRLMVPGLGVTFQTSDLAKLALIMYIARILSIKQTIIRQKDGKSIFYSLLTITVLMCGLILPENFSTAILLFLISYLLMFIGRVRFRVLLAYGIVFLIFIGGLLIASYYGNLGGRTKTWANRMFTFVKNDPEKNYQVNQSKIAIASGGFIKLRPGKSKQRNVLPEAESDFIYAIIVEEYGLVGGIITLSLYLYLLFRAGVIVRKCKRTFPAFLVMGLALLIVTQAIINIAVAVNLIPTTGQPLPLVSKGGTSILFSCIALGMILSVSRTINIEIESETEENT